MLSIYAIEKSEIYGHGKRAVIWFSGCTLRCRGCINKHLWDKDVGAYESVAAVLSKVSEYEDIVGVTLIGGEPLDQTEELLEFINLCKKRKLDTVLFTGYEPEELYGWKREAFELSDVAVCGRYDERLRDTGLLLRGSSNQRLIVRRPSLQKYYEQEARQVEITVTDTETLFLGFPEDFIGDDL